MKLLSKRRRVSEIESGGVPPHSKKERRTKKAPRSSSSGRGTHPSTRIGLPLINCGHP